MSLVASGQNTKLAMAPWLKTSLKTTHAFFEVRTLLYRLGLNTVCTEARCPNRPACWSSGTATFMIMGSTCTRSCRFCSVKTGKAGDPIIHNEPALLANAAKTLKLRYVVLTSVTRDDLPDFGASHFARCVRAIKKHTGACVEVLVPDFRAKKVCIARVLNSDPNVFAHNLETVERLQHMVRDVRASYDTSLNVLRYAKEIAPHIPTKTSLLLGLGESLDELLETMRDLRSVDTDMLVLGQYLQPSKHKLQVARYVPPKEFAYLRRKALRLGFKCVVSAPLARTSYKAGHFYKKLIKGERHGYPSR